MNLTISSNKSTRLITLKIFSIAFFMAVAISFFPIEVFKDRFNYLVYAQSSLEYFYKYLEGGFLRSLFNEPVWLLINILLSRVLDPESVLRVVIFFSAFTSFYLVLKNNPKQTVLVIIFLLSPLVIGKYIIHLRQGLAISFFLIAWYASSRNIKLIFLLLTPFIHASFFFVLFIYLISFLSNKIKLSLSIKIIFYIAVGIGLGLGLGLLAKYLGARQGDQYSFTSTDISGLGFVFWLGVLSLYFFQGKSFLRENTFQIGALLFYLSTYFLIEVTGRIFESSALLVMLSSLSLTNWRKYAFFIAFISFTALQYIARYSQPWLGFGIGV